MDDASASAWDQIYIERADGSDARPLVDSAFNDVEPSISPDAKTVIFTRRNDPHPDRIFVVNVDGAGLHRLIPDGCPEGDRCGDAVEGHPWSPDGQQIAFTRAIYRGAEAVPSNVGIWIMDADGSGAHQITRAGMFCADPCTEGAQDGNAGWSPDGARLVFRRWMYGEPDRFGIFTVATDATDLRRVTPPTLDAEDPAWSPDGNTIVFQSPPDPYVAGWGDQVLYAIRPDGTGLTPLTAHLDGPATNHPSWSPDGSQIIFSHAAAEDVADLWVMDGDGSHLHVLERTPLNENAPFWGIAAAA
jgi:Tol biopolymer transport system component